jgi:hypothetical protein
MWFFRGSVGMLLMVWCIRLGGGGGKQIGQRTSFSQAFLLVYHQMEHQGEAHYEIENFARYPDE